MAQVLVVDGDADVRVLLARTLEREGHTPLISARGKAALDLAKSTVPDLLVLDLSLPDMAGAKLIEAFRSRPETAQVPFVIVSAKGSEPDRVAGLELGADDYVVKPFSLRELMLRLGIVLRRTGATEPTRGTMRRGRLLIDPVQRRAFLDELPIALAPMELKLLATLAASPDQVYSREALLSSVWGLHPHLATRTVDVHVRRLREKLKDAASVIETVRGIGYRFTSKGSGT
jgi:two-component system, OmpR family, phosphate regulon response regulator PhoB